MASNELREAVLDRLSNSLIEGFEALKDALGISDIYSQQHAISDNGLITIGRDPTTQRLILYSNDTKANQEDLSAIDLIISS